MAWYLLLLATSSIAAEPEVAVGEDLPAALTLHAHARILEEQDGGGLHLPNNAYAEWEPGRDPATDGGTFSLWVRPLWPPNDRKSHVFATFKWSGADESYFTLSQGWWEPVGERKLYTVLSNKQLAFCFMPGEFDYTLYLPGQWTMLGVTWRSGDPGFIRLYVDGKRVCERKLSFSGGRRLLGPIFLGSDAAAGAEHRERASDVDLRDMAVAPDVSTDEQMHAAYVRGGGIGRSKWILAIAPDDPPIDVSRERRVMHDEDTGWASSKLEILRRVNRIKLAGFNIYAPCVWDGAHAFYQAAAAPVAPGVRDPIDPQYDPLAYLISVAHAAGIAVHPWFVIVRRAPGAEFPQSFVEGAPKDGFNVHSPEFRRFIADVVVDAARRYDLDGVNLDYIRAIGPCTNTQCLEEYARKYHRSLPEDWTLQEQEHTVPTLIEWNRAAVTDIVRRISSGVRRSRPKAVITVDTVPFDHGRAHQGLDEDAWMRSGMIDAMVDMAYEDPIDIATLDRAMKMYTPARQLVAVRDYDLFGDTVIDRSGAEMSDYVRLIRTRWPGAGIDFYHYPHLGADQISSLGGGVFARTAAPAWVH